MNTVVPSGKNIERSWHIIDAKDLILGRVASKAALLLMGKHKPIYTPFIDTVAEAVPWPIASNQSSQANHGCHCLGIAGVAKVVAFPKLIVGFVAKRDLQFQS